MKHKRFLPCFLFWLCCLSGPVSAGGFKLESPDKNITVQVSIGTRISYTVQYKNEAVMAPSFVLLSLDSNRVLGLNPKLLTDRITGVSTRVRTYAYKRDELNNTYTELTLTFQGNYGMYFRAYNGGVAYRFFTRFKHPVKVLHEEAAFNFPRNGVVYSTCTPDTSFIGTFESLYRTDSLSAFGPASMAFLPVLVCPKPEKTPLKVLITEADLFSYPGMYLKKGADNSLKAVFPKVPANIDYESTTNGGHKIKTPVAREPWLAATTGERSYPWRVLIISDNDAALADNDMVYNLSRPNKLTDLSWLKPGIAVSEEWNNADLTGIDFRAGHNTDTYKHFIDFAAKNKLPYFRIAEGWAKNPDNTDEPASEVNLSEVTEYARKKNVGIILCCNAFAFRNTMQASLQKLAKTGIKGLNIAGIYRDDQQMNDFLEQLTAEAAAVKLFVTFSECAKPAGLSRTYPNELGRECLYGLKQYKTSGAGTTQYNLQLPFIRMAAGPIDYVSGALHNAGETDFRAVYNHPMAKGTRCFQLAEAVVYDACLPVLAEAPAAYENEKDALDLLSKMPVIWDETRILDARFGEYIVTARRKGTVWYVAALNGGKARELRVKTNFIRGGLKNVDWYQDGLNADRNANDYKRIASTADANSEPVLNLAEGGGAVLVISPQ